MTGPPEPLGAVGLDDVGLVAPQAATRNAIAVNAAMGNRVLTVVA
jgi:hypothetical protein